MTVTETIDGLVWDVETGECLGVATPEPFIIADEDSANWVLKKMQEAEAKIEAIDKTPEVIAARALIANADSMKKDAERRYAGLERRFGKELARWAKGQLQGKSKTFKGIFGSISFRDASDRIVVADEELALTWAKVHAPSAIKRTEKFLISEAKDKIDMKNPIAKKAFAIEKGGETFKIKTGVSE
jgi:hypothetical protein